MVTIRSPLGWPSLVAGFGLVFIKPTVQTVWGNIVLGSQTGYLRPVKAAAMLWDGAVRGIRLKTSRTVVNGLRLLSGLSECVYGGKSGSVSPGLKQLLVELTI